MRAYWSLKATIEKYQRHVELVATHESIPYYYHNRTLKMQHNKQGGVVQTNPRTHSTDRNKESGFRPTARDMYAPSFDSVAACVVLFVA